MRTVILGNSGSGKSTLARRLAAEGRAVVLDLDTVAWEPGAIAVPRDPEVARAEVERFCAANDRFVVEGCYADLVRCAEPTGAELLFLDPGTDRCLEHCRARPWEPHKYPSKEEQDRRLSFLLTWVAAYDGREGETGRAAHEAAFDAWTGPKRRLG